MRGIRSRATLIVVAVALLGALLPACQTTPRQTATLSPTLSLRGDRAPIAFQDGLPVPGFGDQPTRPKIDLDGQWRVQPTTLRTDLTMNDRSRTLGAIEREAAGRQAVVYDDSTWPTTEVPGSFDSPPATRALGAWYRRTFVVPTSWEQRTAIVKFTAAQYVADVWVNGVHVGYHEGGSTPFAFDVTDELADGVENTIAVRIDNPTWGTRNDILPWGLADWWNYGGLTAPVWIEQTDPMYVARADVVPHLDGADVTVLVDNRDTTDRNASLTIDMLPTTVTDQNLLDPDPSHLITPGAQPVAQHTVSIGRVPKQSVYRAASSFLLRSPTLWEPSTQPALYVLHVQLTEHGSVVDDYYDEFGLRQIRVDSTFPQLLFNGERIAFRGVAVHDERVEPPVGGQPVGGPITDPADFLAQLRRAMALNANLIRADHHPPMPWLTLLADRLGLAVWEEIPFYHYTPETFTLLMGRGIPQQMLTEMDLRDFNRPSVLFHGFANESTGESERVQALTELRDLDRRVDGTRLTGQAAYGSDPTDDTSMPLDVAGFTFYWGVFYGGALSTQLVADELARAHREYPRKPLMILEFGRWADTPQQEAVDQPAVFQQTYAAIEPRLDDNPGGYIGAAVWWSLDDYWTERPGIQVEHFGAYRPDGSERPVGEQMGQAYGAAEKPQPPRLPREGATAQAPREGPSSPSFAVAAGYAILVPTVLMIALILFLRLMPRYPKRPEERPAERREG